MSDTKECVLCEATSEYSRSAQHRGGCDFYNCPNCGEYITIDFFISLLDGSKHIIAGYLFHTKDRREGSIELDREKIESILNEPIIPQTVMQKLETLLLCLYSQSNMMGYIYDTSDIPHSAAYAKTFEELCAMFWSAHELGWIHCINEQSICNGEMAIVGAFQLTAQGISHAEQILSTNIDSKRVFVAMGFKDDLLEAHEKAIVPACDDCGFVALLISSTEHNNGITDEIIAEIKRSNFVIVDFTYNNCGAYFEAGYAQGLGREVIRCCKKEWFDGVDEKGKPNQLHFDIRHYNTIIWEDLAHLQKRLTSRIRATIPGAKLED